MLGQIDISNKFGSNPDDSQSKLFLWSEILSPTGSVEQTNDTTDGKCWVSHLDSTQIHEVDGHWKKKAGKAFKKVK